MNTKNKKYPGPEKLWLGLANFGAKLHKITIKQMECGNLNKPVYYLWKNDFSTQEEFEAAKEKYRKLGFRIVTYLDGPGTIHEGLKALIGNHYERIHKEVFL